MPEEISRLLPLPYRPAQPIALLGQQITSIQQVIRPPLGAIWAIKTPLLRMVGMILLSAL